ncbi:MAG: hypothetical protein ABFD89_22140 [Bryobacteraceae bacterium]
MYRNCQKCGALMHGPSYPAWQNNCIRCEQDRIKDVQHAEELAKAKSQLVSSGPIVDSQSVAEIENEEIRAELAELRAKLAAATERAEKESREAGRLRDLNGKIQNELDVAQQAVETWAKRGDYWLQERQELIERAEKAERELSMVIDKIKYEGERDMHERQQLIARAEAAEAERDALRARVAELEALQTMYGLSLGELSKRHIARDARMRREGAAEWLTSLAEEDAFKRLEFMHVERLKSEAARLREGGE